MPTVCFELAISLGEIAKVQHAVVPVPALDADTWFIRCEGESVTVHARGGQLGRAAWLQGRLIERTGKPTDAQWKTIATALGRVLRRASTEKRPRLDPMARRILVGALAMCALMVGVAAVFYRIRAKPPHRESLGRFDGLAWADVAKGGETTIPLILKDPARERGRKLCASGTIDAIERTRIDARDVHAGSLRSDGHVIAFVALRSTGSLVARSPATLCGVADGKQIVGLFDVPENKQ